MKNVFKKLLVVLLIMVFGLSVFASCKSKNDEGSSDNNVNNSDNGGNNNTNSTKPEGDFILAKGESVAVVVKEGDNIPDALYDLIVAITDKAPLMVYDSSPENAHEIVIGESNRSVSSKAYRKLEDAIEKNIGEITAGYSIYSNGNSIGIAYDNEISFDIALEVLVSDVLKADSKGVVRVDAGEDYTDSYDLYEKYDELSAEIRNEEYVVLENYINTLGYDGKAIVDSVKQLYSLYSPKAYAWLANLYDPDTGGFYYSVSARETVGFLPDIESTNQALSFIMGTGMQSNLKAALPEKIRNQIISFVQGLQSSEDGYFYHPQWAELVTTDNRRGRDLTWAENTLATLGAKPLYNTPNGVKGTLGAPGQKSEAALTSSFRASVTMLVSKVTPAAAEYLSSEEKFLAYLNSFDWEAGSYGPGNTIAAQAKQIKAAGLMDTCITFLNKLQNPETGMFESFVPGYSDEAVNGFLKVSAAYVVGGYAIPYADKAAETCIDTLTSETPAGTVCWVYNVWYALGNIIGSLNGPNASENDKALAKDIRDELLTNAPEYIKICADKYAPFLKDDGSFSFTPKATSALSQGMPVAIQGTNEGDVNATNISISGVAGYLFGALGLREYEPSIYTKYDWLKFRDTLSSMGSIVKTKFNMFNASDFEDVSIYDVFTSSSYVDIGAEPETLENNKYAYAYITDDHDNKVLHFGKLNEGFEAYVGKDATGFSGKKYTLELKMKYLGGTASTTDPWNARLAMYGNGGRFWTILFYPLADGRIALGSKTAPVAILNPDTWYTLTFEYFADDDVCQFYANGVHIGKAGTVDTSKNDNYYARALFELRNQGTASFYFDDILVKKEDEEYVEPPLNVGDATGDFYKNTENKGTRKDYDALFATVPNLASGPAFSSLNIVNGDLEFKKLNGNGESYIQWDVPANSSYTTPILVVESDIKFSGLTAANFGKIRLYSKDKEITFVTTLKDGAVTIAPVNGTAQKTDKVTIPVEEWHNLRFEIDYTSSTIHIFVDNKHINTWTKVTFSNASGSRKILVYLYTAETSGAVLMDNLFYGLVEDGSFETVLPDDSEEPTTPEIVLPPAVTGTENNGKGVYYAGTATGISGVTKDYASGSAPKLEVPASRVASAVTEIADGVLKYYKINTDNEEYFKQSYTSPESALTNGVAIWEADLSFGNATEGKLGRFTICVNGLEVVIGLHVGKDGKLYFGTEHNVWADSPALDAGKWYNVRFEYYYHETTKSGATGVVKVYLNNEFACTMTGVGVNSRSSWTDIRNLIYLGGSQKSAYLFFDNLYLGFADIERTPDPVPEEDATGDFYLSETAGTRIDYDDKAVELPLNGLNSVTTAAITDGTLVFSRIPDTEGEGWLRWNVSGTNNIFVYETDIKFSGFTRDGAIIKILLQFSGINEQLTIEHGGDNIKIMFASGTGSVTVKENAKMNLRFELDVTARTLNVFVDNEYQGTLTSTSSATQTSYNRFMFYLLKTGYNGTVEFDNIYYGFVEKGSELPAPPKEDATGDYFLSDKTGVRFDYENAATTVPSFSGSGASLKVTDGDLVFGRVSADTYVDSGFQAFVVNSFSGLTSPVFIFETEVKFEGYSAAKTDVAGWIRLYSNDCEIRILIYHDGDNIVVTADGGTGSATLTEGEWHNLRFEIDYENNKVYIYVDNELAGTTENPTVRSASGSRKVMFYLCTAETTGTMYLDNFYAAVLEDGSFTPPVTEEPEENDPTQPEAPATGKGTGVYYNNQSVVGDRYSYDAADATAPTIGDGSAHCTSTRSDGVAVFKKTTNDAESYLKFSKSITSDNWKAENYCTVIEFDYKLDTETAITAYYHHRFRLDSSDYLDLYLNSDSKTYSIGAKDTAAIEVGKWHNVRFEIYFIEDSANGNREYAKVYIDNEYATTKQLATASGYNGRLLVYLAKQIEVDTTVVNIDNMFFGHIDKEYVEETAN